MPADDVDSVQLEGGANSRFGGLGGGPGGPGVRGPGSYTQKKDKDMTC